MAHVFLHHVVGDLTLGKPELVQFYDSEPVEAAVRAIGDSAEGAITVWRSPSPDSAAVPRPPPSADRFVGMLNSLDVVLFLARARVHDQEKSMRTPVSELITPNHDLLKEVDPATRLIDALDMMKQGVRRLLVRKSVMWRGFSKRFSVLYNGKWLKNSQSSSVGGASNSDRPSSSVLHENKYCCLSREDIVRFLIGCLGALAPLPLSSISSLGAINSNYSFIEAFSPTLEAIQKIPHNPCAIAVVETNSDGTHKIIGDISAYKLWKCDYWAAAWAMRNLSAGQFVLGADDYGTALDSSLRQPPTTSSCQRRRATCDRRRATMFDAQSLIFISKSVFGRYTLWKLFILSFLRQLTTPQSLNTSTTSYHVRSQHLSSISYHLITLEEEEEEERSGILGYTLFLALVIDRLHHYLRKLAQALSFKI
ncbi:hypothetical protein ZIOFF_045341 [Zingiber officinale]|uniref:CBS domain-containing protein CBSX6 n=1 Tax=Zingiber officinale TaxID=94328 RepID=A0A8J5L124_ZINOF|nr:hypothetical protein ZIOFF_045341 [Zingiber officinale]